MQPHEPPEYLEAYGEAQTPPKMLGLHDGVGLDVEAARPVRGLARHHDLLHLLPGEPVHGVMVHPEGHGADVGVVDLIALPEGVGGHVSGTRLLGDGLRGADGDGGLAHLICS